MTIGIVGLGRLGANMARRLRRAEVPLVAFNRSEAVTRRLGDETGLIVATSLG
ncbi:MAG: NAD(P)-binding domain-containing protein, partial [Thiotrichales bacterium]